MLSKPTYAYVVSYHLEYSTARMTRSIAYNAEHIVLFLRVWSGS